MENSNRNYDVYNKSVSLINDNKFIIYTMICYLSGILIASLLYTKLDIGLISNLIDSIEQGNNTKFSGILINNLIVNNTMFFVLLILGSSCFGFLFINASFVLYGYILGVMLCNNYVQFSIKGIGYSLLMIIPFATIITLLLLYTAQESNTICIYLYKNIIKKSDAIIELNLKSHLIKYVLLFFAINIATITNSALVYLLKSIIVV